MKTSTFSPAVEHQVTVGRHNGGMSMFVDGVFQPFTCFKITETGDLQQLLDSAEVEIPAMAERGIRLCWVPIFINWRGPGDYDFSDMDRRIQTVLQLYDAHTPEGEPQALIGIRIQAAVFTPPWYIRQAATGEGLATNLVKFCNSTGAAVDALAAEHVIGQRFATQSKETYSTLAISLGDSFWDTHAIDCVKAIVAHARASDYAGRVFGYLPCAFNSNEWFLRTFAAYTVCDFSAPTQRAFRKYLQAEGIPCGDEPVPGASDCLRADRCEFLDPANPASRLVETFSLWLNNRMADIVLNFTHNICSTTADSPKLIGVFYGYSLGLSRLSHLPQSGHLVLTRLLESPDLDFICSPAEYCYRAAEDSFTASFVMGGFAGSAAANNKLVFLEDDHRPAEVKNASACFDTRDFWHAEMFFRQNFAQTLAQSQQQWWYSL